jgi:CheY-like chemotaxis protein
LVDDDVRSTFALANLLEHHRLEVVYAENGKKGLELLERIPDIDLVLMDMMMPEMSGYEAIRAIRAMPQHHSLPIIALTAKALKGDREECIQAGASDYIPKPVDMDQLLSLLRVWLYR